MLMEIYTVKAIFQQPSAILTSFNDKIAEAAWNTICVNGPKRSDDETIDMALKHRLVHFTKARVARVKGSHTLFMKQPDAVACIITTSAREASN